RKRHREPHHQNRENRHPLGHDCLLPRSNLSGGRWRGRWCLRGNAHSSIADENRAVVQDESAWGVAIACARAIRCVLPIGNPTYAKAIAGFDDAFPVAKASVEPDEIDMPLAMKVQEQLQSLVGLVKVAAA